MMTAFAYTVAMINKSIDCRLALGNDNKCFLSTNYGNYYHGKYQ